jgi:hypothetical protein
VCDPLHGIAVLEGGELDEPPKDMPARPGKASPSTVPAMDTVASTVLGGGIVSGSSEEEGSSPPAPPLNTDDTPLPLLAPSSSEMMAGKDEE